MGRGNRRLLVYDSSQSCRDEHVALFREQQGRVDGVASVKALDPAVLCRVLDQLGYVNAIGVLDNIYLFSYLRSAAITYEKCMYKKLSHLVSCLFPCVNTEFTSSSVVWSIAAVK